MGMKTWKDGLLRSRRVRRPGGNIILTCVWQHRVGPPCPCASVLFETVVQVVCGKTRKSLLSDYLTGFGSSTHTLICLNETWKRLGSFETPPSFRNHGVYTCHELVCVRNTLVTKVLFGVCHIQTYVKKETSSHKNLSKMIFRTRHTTSVTSVSRIPKHT